MSSISLPDSGDKRFEHIIDGLRKLYKERQGEYGDVTDNYNLLQVIGYIQGKANRVDGLKITGDTLGKIGFVDRGMLKEHLRDLFRDIQSGAPVA